MGPGAYFMVTLKNIASLELWDYLYGISISLMGSAKALGGESIIITHCMGDVHAGCH